MTTTPLGDYGSGIFAFLSYNYRNEGYIVEKLSRQLSAPIKYSVVRIELLYGSHSADVRITLFYDDDYKKLVYLDWYGKRLVGSDIIYA